MIKESIGCTNRPVYFQIQRWRPRNNTLFLVDWDESRLSLLKFSKLKVTIDVRRFIFNDCKNNLFKSIMLVKNMKSAMTKKVQRNEALKFLLKYFRGHYRLFPYETKACLKLIKKMCHFLLHRQLNTWTLLQLIYVRTKKKRNFFSLQDFESVLFKIIKQVMINFISAYNLIKHYKKYIEILSSYELQNFPISADIRENSSINISQVH